VLGVDANALYLWCVMQDMPIGHPIVRESENNFIPKSPRRQNSKAAHAWLDHVGRQLGIVIRHDRNYKEKRIGRHGLPVDGYHEETNTVFQFHGCFWHGHPCSKTRGLTTHPYRKMSMDEVYSETLEKEKYVEDLGYNLKRVWECEWEGMLRRDPSMSKQSRSYITKEYGHPGKSFTQREILELVKGGKMFGLIKCDISVPDRLRSRFSEMAPIFKNTLVSREELGEHMLSFAKETGRLKQPQRSLVGSLHGKGILLASALAKWYLEQGLEITKVYCVYEYTPSQCYQKFGETVSKPRLGSCSRDK